MFLAQKIFDFWWTFLQANANIPLEKRSKVNLLVYKLRNEIYKHFGDENLRNAFRHFDIYKTGGPRQKSFAKSVQRLCRDISEEEATLIAQV